MKLRRDTLLRALRAVKPALAEGTNQLEALSHIWFNGTAVSAYDGIVGVQLGFKTDFVGGVLGAKLLSVVEKSEAPEIELEVAPDDNLVLKGGSTVKFALRSIDEWFWRPVVPKVDAFDLTADFIKAIQSLMFSVGRGKVLTPEQRGITVIQSSGGVDLYSTDLLTVSWVGLDFDYPLLTKARRVVLPTSFCEQLAKFKSNGQLLIDDRAAYVAGEVTTGEVTDDKAEDYASVVMRADLIEEDDPVPFNRIADKVDAAAHPFDIPTRMGSSLDQALVLLGDNQPIALEVDAKRVYLLAQSPYGHFDDKIDYEGDHPDVYVKVDASLLRRGIDGRKSLAVTDNSVVTFGPGSFVHVIATK